LKIQEEVKEFEYLGEMNRFFLFIFLIGFSLSLSCQDELVKIPMGERGTLAGMLLMPKTKKPVPVVLLIAGSGPTDHNGNQSSMENNSLKLIADTLAVHGIASLRYDKRGVGLSDRGLDSPKEVRFSHFVEDAGRWLKYLSGDKRFSRIIIGGHSEGSLVGMVAAQSNSVDAFISIAGPGRPLDIILKEQLSGFVPEARSVVYGIIDKLKQGDTIGNIPPLLYSLFHPSIQPYLISIFKYDPANEIAKLHIPTMIVQGTTDIQVSLVDAETLSAAKKDADLEIIPNMNHVLKFCDYKEKKQQIEKIYGDPNLPLNSIFAEKITSFILSIPKVSKG
jgi:pimeloyl-ACP methyl ester carboxylesterase